jgi:two-component system, chemotaxis family, chemotaxis protein CheY
MKKVLIVDDQPFIRQIFRQLVLQIAETEVSEAENGNAALGVMKVSHPDLVLLDITMPGKDGLAVLEEMKNNPELFDIPVVVISAHADQEAHALELGAKAFVNKVMLNDIDLAGMIKMNLGLE